jgi:hypothetical protein
MIFHPGANLRFSVAKRNPPKHSFILVANLKNSFATERLGIQILLNGSLTFRLSFQSRIPRINKQLAYHAYETLSYTCKVGHLV